jgi:hypothetical protein
MEGFTYCGLLWCDQLPACSAVFLIKTDFIQLENHTKIEVFTLEQLDSWLFSKGQA